ncbi:hypothetical protein [Pseudomonas sp. BE134]|uniref:hypothetical protein n=1 Tax=Pseudomonas sp. BE134 TaxID=2817843 RepID=UPI0028669AA4|nr:hypothetical protein [Pseudomonas sp. BE134]MDR6924795.1 hypothetical protein [Pseudomonas sp. BE134]
MTTEDPAQLVKRLEQLCQQLENNLAVSEGVPMPLAEKAAVYVLGYVNGMKAAKPDVIPETLYEKLMSSIGKQAGLDAELDWLLLP